LVINYNRALVGASLYDPLSGLIVFGIPNQAPKFKPGKTRAIVLASDYQESKNVNTVGSDLMPNTAFLQTRLTVVNGPTVTWIEPPARVCAVKNEDLLVVAGSTTKVTQVIFSDNGRRIGVDKAGPGGVYGTTWRTSKLGRGHHRLTATVVDRSGRKAAAGRQLRICR
ncbi:MAG: hypothetical protein ACJ74P_12335, partial [Gaiellaceae bacterium]